MILGTGNLGRHSLAGRVAVITGVGGGIGYEAARSLLWLGCQVVIAEINPQTGKQATRNLNQEFGPGTAMFIQTDVGDEGSVKRLARRAERACGRVDIVLNNATIAPLGAVQDLDIKVWDSSYRVNLRGPVLLACAFVPGMVARNWGVFVCVSSTGGPYMGAYEALKAAQVQLGTTLHMELENTKVSAFRIGPGFVPAKTATSSIPVLAAMMGKSEQEMQQVLRPHTLSVEAAGAGFAAAVAMASRYRGQEISSMQALEAAGHRARQERARLGTGRCWTIHERRLSRQMHCTLDALAGAAFVWWLTRWNLLGFCWRSSTANVVGNRVPHA